MQVTVLLQRGRKIPHCLCCLGRRKYFIEAEKILEGYVGHRGRGPGGPQHDSLLPNQMWGGKTKIPPDIDI